ncbi:MAG: DNA gyrase inhibitor YacG [Nitrospirae bacterium]|nr:DNA gyrase inhibitor YacG [Nitrospirota bacterium]
MKVKCPNCKKEIAWEGNPYRPFCSERCKTSDLAAWASDKYRIPGDRVDSHGEPTGNTGNTIDSTIDPYGKESDADGADNEIIPGNGNSRHKKTGGGNA